MNPEEPAPLQDETLSVEGGRPSWVVHPASEKPARCVLVLAGIAALLFAVYFMMAGWFWVVFSAVILAVSLRQFFLPTRFDLTDEAAISRLLWYSQKRPWGQFKSYFVDRNGVLLSPFPGPSRLENFRGFYLIGANRDPKTMEFIERKVKRAGTL